MNIILFCFVPADIASNSYFVFSIYTFTDYPTMSCSAHVSIILPVFLSDRLLDV